MLRLFDILVSVIVLVCLSPLLAAIAVAVKLYDGGPVFYAGKRVGRGGKPIRILKFRTMIPDADRQGPGITTSSDERITPLGRLLRKTKLDEFPQFANVLLGDMSLVGPRPEDPRYVARYTDEQRALLSVRPGITSPASLQYYEEEALLSGEEWEERYLTEILPRKLRIEAEYQKHRTFSSDIGIILKTSLRPFRKRASSHSYHPPFPGYR